MWKKNTKKTPNGTKLRMWQNSERDKSQRIKMWQNSKNKNLKKKHIISQCNKIQKIKMWQKSKAQIATKLKSQNISKHKNSKFDKTQKLKRGRKKK